jgi:tRNA(fMet)-specific endonuclease VapC
MTGRCLVDTDWIIHWLNGHPAIGRRLEEVRPQGVALSVVSLAELYEGIYHSHAPDRNERDLRNFLTGLTLLGVDQETCQVFGRERGRLRAARTMIADLDLLIGATALRHELTVLTNNRRHFGLIQGLRIES